MTCLNSQSLRRSAKRFFGAAVSGRALCLLAVAALALPACQNGMPWQRQTNPPLVVEPAPLAPSTDAYVAPVVDQPGLQLSTEQRFKDVPVPQGAKADLERSFVFESASLHVGRMVYTTRATLADIAQFYIREAPTGQWQLQDTTEAEKSISLVFNKPGSRMLVNVQDIGMAKGRRLMVTITPEGSGGGGL